MLTSCPYRVPYVTVGGIDGKVVMLDEGRIGAASAGGDAVRIEVVGCRGEPRVVLGNMPRNRNLD